MAHKQQRATLADVAREAGVSMMTVSRVIHGTGRISDDTRQHVREIIEKMEYRPNRAARTLVTKRTFTIGFVAPDITNPYFTEILQGVEEFFWREGYNVLLANSNENPDREKAILEQLEDTMVDGVIVCSSRLSDDELLPLIAKHAAVVAVNRNLPQHLGSVVTTRHPRGYRAVLAAKYLHETGRQRIGYINLVRSISSVNLDMFMRELQSLEIPINPNWYATCQPNWQAGYDTASQLIAGHPELDAIIAGNDLVALGAMRAAKQYGRHIPDDLALIGGDDILMASQVTPALTTFRSDKYNIGTTAAKLLLQRIGGDMTYCEHHYQDELIIREST
ncbi:MAG: LacI family DNA-binding transcriptional regulator [Chloroflexi bacterium]|nr:LacI family DNA-binding transcriptional regulator [Chloroflexota bacterium]